MKILYVVPNLRLGGAEVLVAKLAVIAQQNKCDVKLLVFEKVYSLAGQQ